MNNPDELTDGPGAYLLLIRLRETVLLPRRFADQSLPKGRYGYAGSAYSPGGIRARCRHHLGSHGKRHWHIDWLTRSADDVQAVAFPNGSECSLIQHLISDALTRFPIKGFGSTDCRLCQAHLVQFEGHGSWDELSHTLDLESRHAS